jgi:hypothetical protein
MLVRNKISMAVALALASMAMHAGAQSYNGVLTQGVSSSQTPYVQGVAGVDITSILTVGDSIGGYGMVGIPDGLGAFDNGNGTFTVLMNHELGNTVGVARAHGGIGAFVSEWIIDKSSLAVLQGGDLIQKVYGWDTATQSTGALLSNFAFNRFCSADLSPVTAYYNAATGLGTQSRIFMSGEEGGATGYQMATVATGTDKGSSYVLGKFNLATNGSGISSVGGWENALANPYSQDKTVVIGNNDGGTGIMTNALAVYVGTKTNSGSDVDRAGLTNGVTKFVNVTGSPVEIAAADATTRNTSITNGARFTLGDTASTTFSRPEDGAWNTAAGKQNEFFFVTTDRIDNTELTGGTQKGATRLWRLTFDDIANPNAGGKVDLLIDGGATTGSGKPNMFDNITVNKDGTITLQEDPGGADHNAKIWLYNPADGSLQIIARVDPARFGDVVGGAFTGPAARTTPTASGYHTFDEETSGVIDVTDILDPSGASGRKYSLFVVQDHASAAALQTAGLLGAGNPAALVEGGQLLLMTQPVPEPSTYALLGVGMGLVGLSLRRHRRGRKA